MPYGNPAMPDAVQRPALSIRRGRLPPVELGESAQAAWWRCCLTSRGPGPIDRATARTHLARWITSQHQMGGALFNLGRSLRLSRFGGRVRRDLEAVQTRGVIEDLRGQHQLVGLRLRHERLEAAPHGVL